MLYFFYRNKKKWNNILHVVTLKIRESKSKNPLTSHYYSKV